MADPCHNYFPVLFTTVYPGLPRFPLDDLVRANSEKGEGLLRMVDYSRAVSADVVFYSPVEDLDRGFQDGRTGCL